MRFRVTVRATNSFYVWPASHVAGSNSAAPPNGTRLRMKASKDISGYPPEMQKIFRAMKKYGLIVADNGSDMYIGGAFDPRWNNDVLNPAFHSLHANDFEVVQLGWRGTTGPPQPPCTLPAAPANLWSSVTGYGVSLGWTPPTGALAGHVLDVGSGPGQTNIGSLPIAAPAASFAATAPAGRYYVRVRAGSACGVGAASNEIVLDVPSGCGVPTAPGTLAYSRIARTVVAGLGTGVECHDLRRGGRLQPWGRQRRDPRCRRVSLDRGSRASRHLLRAGPGPERLRAAGAGGQRDRGRRTLISGGG